MATLHPHPRHPDASVLDVSDFISAPRGERPLDEVTRFAASYFGVEYVHIAMLEADQKSVRVISGFLDGKNVEPGYIYALRSTPCENVVAHEHKCYAKEVQKLFPKDHDLVDLHAQGYIGEPINDANGEAIGLIVLVSRHTLDSSQLIAASMRMLANYVSTLIYANELNQEHERYKHIMLHAADGIILHDMERGIVDFNHKAKEMLGYDDKEMYSLNVTDIDAALSPQQVETLSQKLSEGPFTIETIHRRKDGTLYDAAVTISKIELHGQPFVYTSIHDISQQKKLQRELEQSESFLKTVIDEFPDVLLVKDENAKYILANKAVAKLYGTAPEAMIGKDDADFGVPKELSDFMRNNVLEIMQRGETEIVYEDSRDAQTKKIHHFKSIKKPFKTIDGKQQILVIAQDITDAITIKEELEKNHKKLQAILQLTRDAYWLVDQDGILLEVNDAMCDMIGYSRQELLGMSIADIDAHENSGDVRDRMGFIAQKGSARFEAQHRRKEGTVIDVEVSVTHIPSQNFFIAFIRNITDQKAYANELAHQKGFLRTLIDTIPDLIWLKDPDGVYLACNPRFEEFFGAKESDIIGKTDYDFVDKELADWFRVHDKKAMEANTPTVDEEEIPFASDGHKELVEATKTPMYDTNGKLIGILGIAHDITALRAFEKSVQESEQSFRSLFNSLREAVYVQDEKGTFLAVNEGASKMYGYPQEWFIGKSPLDVAAPGMNDLDALVPAHQKALEGEPQSFEFWALRFDGTPFPKEVHQTKGKWFGKDVVFAVALDITERKKHEEQLRYIANYDALTSLPNRLLLADRLRQAIALSKRHATKLSVAYLDLDGFKAINDIHGHAAGDQLLITISHRLKSLLREEDTLARLGGDEFVAVLIGMRDTKESDAILQRMLQAVSTPVIINNHALQVSASIGVTTYSKEEALDADTLIRQSDQAMYLAKQSGKNRYCYFDAEHERTLQGKHQSLQSIGEALQNGEFVLYYQPKVNLRTGKTIGAEALIRWQHPQQGLLMPISFLPAIENHTLCIDVGEWVLESALSQMQKWQDAGIHMPLSVNIDGLHLQQENFASKLQELLQRYPRIDPNDLELEVLETSALDDIVQVSEQIAACQRVGVHFALDDFGTGYSSLTYLRRLQVQTLKIDKSFVIDMLDDPEDLAILEGVLGLAGTFKREAIAEGVESEAHIRMLLRMGCELAQGYAIAKPMSAEALEVWLKEYRPLRDYSDFKTLQNSERNVLYAITEHRLWMKKAENRIRAQNEDILMLDSAACEFGKWLESSSAAMHNNDSVDEIKKLHQEIRQKASSLISTAKELSPEALESQMMHLNLLKERLLERLCLMLDE